ncbi:TonB-dependent receptor [Rapidithrix thailandica]|uniref:TonB-dependent receptor n=1 Tax=Rapidithrix thailandica TaxID=413964 RepID=A0AAW9RZE3_9BACT
MIPSIRVITSLLILGLFIQIPVHAQEKVTLSGYVRDKDTGEELIGASVLIKELSTGNITNVYGFYSVSIPAGSYTVQYSYVGYLPVVQNMDLTTDKQLNIELAAVQEELEEVVVMGEKEDANISSVEMSANKLEMKTIQKMPPLLGEVDLIRSIQLLPGVTTVGEGASGFNVRGGGVGENLVLLDEAPVYNSSHMFGFFSVFNPDAVKDMKLLKGGIPAQFGGRTSSILDVRMKEGNSKQFTGSGGVGLIFSRLTLEAPIVKDKGSFIISGRRSYADILAKPFLNEDLENSIFYFYDLTVKANYRFGQKDRLFLSGYFGKDKFDADDIFKSNWGNKTGTLRWNHLFNDQLFFNLSLFYSDYDYNLNFGKQEDSFEWASRIVNYNVKPEFIFYPNTKNEITFGGQLTFYDFKPGEATGTSAGDEIDISLDNKYAMEGAVYAGNEQTLSDRLTLQYGLRYSFFNYLGKGTSYEYDQNGEKGEQKEVIGSKEWGKGEVIETYHNLEPRLALKYELNPSSSLKASYNRMVQYIHLVSNTTASTPLDVWTPSTNNIKPMKVDQVALGYFKNFKDNVYETSVEVYYKDFHDVVEYIDGADLLLNEYLEGELLAGVGRAYGVELYAKKNKGKLNGWVSYTLSRSERKVEGVNKDKWFPNRFDQTHNLSVVAFYELNKRWSVSGNFSMISGTPTTFPTNRLEYQGYIIPHNYNDTRNNYRIPLYHRLDLSATLHGKKKEGRKWESFWVFSLYNVYNQKNPFSIAFRQQTDRIAAGNNIPTEAVKLSVFGSIIPSVSYNFKF